MGMKAMKINDKRIGLSLNLIQNTKQRNQDKNTNHKTQNPKPQTWSVQNQSKTYLL
jgi:hypothetical protein